MSFPEEMNLNPNYLISVKREQGELDLVGLYAQQLSAHIDDTASAIFLADAGIQQVVDSKPVIQRLFINRFLINLLLRYRAIDDVLIVNTIQYIINDGTVEDWMTLQTTVVLKFLSDNKVFPKLYTIN